jgi:hypothetical protein
MKASLIFDLKEDQHTFDCMMNAVNMHSVILEMREHLRAMEKYHTLSDDELKVVVGLRDWLHEEISSQGLSQLF